MSTFLTCGSDETIRIWNLKKNSDMQPNYELKRILYFGDETDSVSSLCEQPDSMFLKKH